MGGKESSDSEVGLGRGGKAPWLLPPQTKLTPPKKQRPLPPPSPLPRLRRWGPGTVTPRPPGGAQPHSRAMLHIEGKENKQPPNWGGSSTSERDFISSCLHRGWGGGTRWGRSPPSRAPLHSKAAASIRPRPHPGVLGPPWLGRLQGGGGSCCSPRNPSKQGGRGLPLTRRSAQGVWSQETANLEEPNQHCLPAAGAGQRDTPAQSPGAPPRLSYATTNSDFISALTSGFQTESSKSRSRLPSLETLLLLLVRPALRLGTQW